MILPDLLVSILEDASAYEKEAVEGGVNHLAPLVCLHEYEQTVFADSGIVYQHRDSVGGV